jgi:hypothetical protein
MYTLLKEYIDGLVEKEIIGIDDDSEVEETVPEMTPVLTPSKTEAPMQLVASALNSCGIVNLNLEVENIKKKREVASNVENKRKKAAK